VIIQVVFLVVSLVEAALPAARQLEALQEQLVVCLAAFLEQATQLQEILQEVRLEQPAITLVSLAASSAELVQQALEPPRVITPEVC
jgi:hypothetical protein